MKVVLVFLLFVAVAAAWKPMRNFDPERFTGKWYLQYHNNNKFATPGTRDLSVTYDSVSDGFAIVHKFLLPGQGGWQYRPVHYYQGSSIASSGILNEDGHEIPYFMAFTDYDTVAFPVLNQTEAGILMRKPFPSVDELNYAMNLAQFAGMDPDSLVVVPHNPELHRKPSTTNVPQFNPWSMLQNFDPWARMNMWPFQRF